MVNIEVKSVKELLNFLTIIGKFTSQCLFEVYKDKVVSYCKNTTEFSSARLDIESNVMLLDEKSNYECIKLCIRDINAFRSSINIITLVLPDNSSIKLNVLEIITPTQEIFGRKISYKGKAKFSLITIDHQVIESFISTAIKADIEKDIVWTFNIDPRMLDIIQNRTSSIVNVQDDVSIYISDLVNDDGSKQVVCSLVAKKSSYNNSVALPISNDFEGSTESIKSKNIDPCISCSSFRLVNVLRVSDKLNLRCSFNNRYNFFKIDSLVTKDDVYIKSMVLINLIKGK